MHATQLAIRIRPLLLRGLPLALVLSIVISGCSLAVAQALEAQRGSPPTRAQRAAPTTRRDSPTCELAEARRERDDARAALAAEQRRRRDRFFALPILLVFHGFMLMSTASSCSGFGSR